MSKKNRRGSAYERARMARLAAVQAYYQIIQREQSASVVIDEFVLQHLLSDDYNALPDVDLFRQLVFGAFEKQTEIKAIIESSLNQDWRYERLEDVLKALLYISTGELLTHPTSAPAPVIIMEYTTITCSFYEGKEIAFMNSYLDRLARNLGYPMTKPSQEALDKA